VTTGHGSPETDIQGEKAPNLPRFRPVFMATARLYQQDHAAVRTILTRLLSTMTGAAALAVLTIATPAAADRIRNPTAVFAGLDKITGRIISFEVAIDETVQFGALQLTPKTCWSRPPSEQPQTTSFVEVDEVTFSNEYRRIFGGWMFASSPGLHGIEHPVYDVWLTDCKGGTEIIVDAKEPEQPLPPDTERRDRPRPQRPAGEVQPAGRIDVAPPQGVPVQPRQAPSQRFFPTNPTGGGIRSPDGGNR
jgi:hypothetical protein